MNAPDYYFFDGRTYRGPLPLSELRQYPPAPQHWYWTTGMSRWVPLEALPPAEVPPAEPPPVRPQRPRPGGTALRSVGGGLMLGGLGLQAARLLPTVPDWVTQAGFYAVQLVLYAGLLRLGQQAHLLGVRVGAGLAALALVLEASQASSWPNDAPPADSPLVPVIALAGAVCWITELWPLRHRVRGGLVPVLMATLLLQALDQLTPPVLTPLLLLNYGLLALLFWEIRPTDPLRTSSEPFLSPTV